MGSQDSYVNTMGGANSGLDEREGSLRLIHNQDAGAATKLSNPTDDSDESRCLLLNEGSKLSWTPSVETVEKRPAILPFPWKQLVPDCCEHSPSLTLTIPLAVRDRPM